MRLKRTLGSALLILSLSASGLAWGGTLRIGKPSVDGENVSFPVVLEGDVGAGVSQANFRLTYDADVLEPVAVETGSAAASANKDVNANLTTDGQYNVIVFGLNRSTITEGEVAQVVMRRKGDSTDSTKIGVEDVTLADANAGAIPSRGTTETLKFDGSDTVPDDETTDPATDETATPDGTDTETGDGTTPTNTDASNGAADGAANPGTAAPVAGGGARVPLASLPKDAGAPKDLTGTAPAAGAAGQVNATAGAPAAGASAAAGSAAAARDALNSMGIASTNPAEAPGTTGGTAAAPGTAEATPERTPVATLAVPGQSAAVTGVVAQEATKAVATGAARPTGSPLALRASWLGILAAVVVIVGAILVLRRRMFS